MIKEDGPIKDRWTPVDLQDPDTGRWDDCGYMDPDEARATRCSEKQARQYDMEPGWYRNCYTFSNGFRLVHETRIRVARDGVSAADRLVSGWRVVQLKSKPPPPPPIVVQEKKPPPPLKG